MGANKGDTRLRRTRPRGFVLHHLHDHFIPHDGNGHVPKSLRHKNLLAYSAAIIGLKVLLVVLPAILPAHLLYSSSITQANIVALTNQSRAANGLASLSIHPLLTSAAQARANDMMARQYFSHAGPDGERAWSWIRGAGYLYKYAGENLALYFDSAEGVHSGWLASATHRANLLSKKYSEIGVGVAQGEFEGYSTFLVVQFFGEPAEPRESAAEETDAPETLLAQNDTEISENTPNEEPDQSEESIEEEEIGGLPEAGPRVIAEAEPAEEPPSEEAPPELPEEPAEKELEAEEDTGGVAATVLGTDAVPPEIQSVDIRPAEDGFYISAVVSGAHEVRVLNQTHVTGLTQSSTDQWTGTVSVSDEQNEWRLLARSKEGAEALAPIADFLPDAEVATLYAGVDMPAESPLPSWLNYPNISKGIHGLYLYLILFLVAAVLLKFFIKIHLQKWSVLAHAFAVIALAILMLVI